MTFGRILVKAAKSKIRADVKYHGLLGNGHQSFAEQFRWEKSRYSKKTTCPGLQSRRGGIVIGCAVLLILLYCFSSPTTSLQPGLDISEENRKPKHFRLIIPASQADANLCKTLTSAAILGYPTPVLINWNQTFEEPNLIFGGSRTAKIDAVLEQLRKIDSMYDDDLVLIADGYDVWFQLRPDVLIGRYFDINRKANERLFERLGHSVIDREQISQKVIFSSQKRCYPKGQNHPACWAVPESILPPDVYGLQTDTDVGDEYNPYLKFRQRYLNSGSVIGTVAAVKEVFERAAEVFMNDRNIGSDQGVFSQIFGEQEFYRRHLAMRSRSVSRKVVDWILKNTGRDYSYRLIDPKKQGSHHFINLKEGHRYEFGIGLDYESLILQATIFSENDSDWIMYNDQSSIRKASTARNVPGLPRIGSLPADINASPSPFGDLANGFSSGISAPVKSSWADVPLFTNIWTGFSPVAIHHNAHRNGLKNRIQTEWSEMWYQSHARTLLDARLSVPQQPLTVTTRNGPDQEWYSPALLTWTQEWSHLSTDSDYPLHFDQLCAGTWQEIFRDNSGEWTDSRKLSTYSYKKTTGNNDAENHDWDNTGD